MRVRSADPTVPPEIRAVDSARALLEAQRQVCLPPLAADLSALHAELGGLVQCAPGSPAPLVRVGAITERARERYREASIPVWEDRAQLERFEREDELA